MLYLCLNLLFYLHVHPRYVYSDQGLVLPPPSNLLITVGSNSLLHFNQSAQRVAAKKFYIHPRYNKSSILDFNIALILLETKLTYASSVRPVCLYQTSNLDEDENLCLITGFGPGKLLVYIYFVMSFVRTQGTETEQSDKTDTTEMHKIRGVIWGGGLGAVVPPMKKKKEK